MNSSSERIPFKVEPQASGLSPTPGSLPFQQAGEFGRERAAIIARAQSCAAKPKGEGRAAEVEEILAAALQLLQTMDREPAGAASTSAAAGTAPHRVLYIEDDLVNFTLVLRILAARGNYHLEQAASGEAGMEAALSQRPDLILLDLNLPDIHGSEVLGRLQESPLTAHIPVIIISADATGSQIERLLAAGARDYLIKPFNIQKFLGVMDGAMEEIKGKKGIFPRRNGA